MGYVCSNLLKHADIQYTRQQQSLYNPRKLKSVMMWSDPNTGSRTQSIRQSGKMIRHNGVTQAN